MSLTAQTSQPQWLLDINSTSLVKSRNTSIPDPPGYTAPATASSKSKKSVSARKVPTPEEMDSLKLKKAWELAIAPAKQLPMNAIGMYMTGNGLQIFSIMMVFMLFKGPIQAVLNIQNTFSRLESPGNKEQMIMVKLAFIGCNVLALALGIWKVNAMGLLPTTRSDWLAWESAREPAERAYFVPSR
ncbi:Putative TMEM85/ER membrane protein complex subunit 4 [Septoria linicola]|uniref:ER membrane protein complex subunit 4 n=1 Tax=Septoria linicola TaxID=215465 RepID=A0A9Q9AS20_9PEZI|nr:putative TMEM85/ER membrane protein complex subunit 4 [Septoria linicola]USW54727.1 Putative TMEM85/ER membrane protein complex subunit 4 [Septoria linicola]